MSGVELLSSLNEHEIRIPFIIFTDEDTPALRDLAYRYDAYGFIFRNDPQKRPYKKLLRLMYWAAGYLD